MLFFRVVYVRYNQAGLLCGHFLVCESVGASCSVVISKINMKSVLFFAVGVFAVFQTG